MAKHKAAHHEEEPEVDESQDTGEEPENESQDTSDKPSNADMVRDALSAGHMTAKPGKDYILKKYGIPLTDQQFNGAKQAIGKSKGVRAPRLDVVTAEDGSGPTYSGASARVHKSNNATGVDSAPSAAPNFKSVGNDLKIIKDLLGKYDADKLKSLFGTIAELDKKYGASGIDDMIDLVDGLKNDE